MFRFHWLLGTSFQATSALGFDRHWKTKDKCLMEMQQHPLQKWLPDFTQDVVTALSFCLTSRVHQVWAQPTGVLGTGHISWALLWGAPGLLRSGLFVPALGLSGATRSSRRPFLPPLLVGSLTPFWLCSGRKCAPSLPDSLALAWPLSGCLVSEL